MAPGDAAGGGPEHEGDPARALVLPRLPTARTAVGLTHMSDDQVTLFTDGACENNPGRGGWAFLLRTGTNEKTLSGGYRKTTNNRMELRALIEGLKALDRPGLKVTIVCDSRYVTEAISEGWLDRWAAKQFKKGEGFRENSDLWIELRPLLTQHQVTMKWIRGHFGHPKNETCDQMAVAARAKPRLPIDEGYENPTGRLVTLGETLL